MCLTQWKSISFRSSESLRFQGDLFASIIDRTPTYQLLDIVNRLGRVQTIDNDFLFWQAMVIIWDFAERKIKASHEIHKVRVEDVCFTNDQRYLISLGGIDDGCIVVWNVENGTPLCGNFYLFYLLRSTRSIHLYVSMYNFHRRYIGKQRNVWKRYNDRANKPFEKEFSQCRGRNVKTMVYRRKRWKIERDRGEDRENETLY